MDRDRLGWATDGGRQTRVRWQGLLATGATFVMTAISNGPNTHGVQASAEAAGRPTELGECK